MELTRAELEHDAERFKQDHLGACQTIAEMHAAATGRRGLAPIRGVVEDMADVRTAMLRAEAERDGAYHERAQLLALLASLHPSVIAPALDVDEDGWQILYLRIGGKQASWHIAPRDAELYAHVEHVPADDRRAQWDGHTTEQKYEHIGQHAARLYAEARSRVETPAAEQYRFATTWSEYHAGRAALDEPKES